MPLDWNQQWDDPNLNIMFKNDVQAMLGTDEGHWRVVKPAFRSFAEQDALYAQGRSTPGEIVTQAKGGQSPHNHGLAVNVTLVKPDYGVTGKETYNYTTDDAWTRLWQKCNAAPRLHSGYHFNDQDHIEAQPKWRTLRQQLIDEGKWDNQGG